MSNNNCSISRVFSKKVLIELLEKGTNNVYDYVIRRYIDNPDTKTNGEILSEIYAKLSKSYRNEYFYTNTLLNKLLVGIHNVNTTTALAQVRIADHIADFVMINGEGNVYEIKSELDNLERLNAQILDYYKAFSKVSVLASERESKNVEKVLKKLGSTGEYVGIFVLTERDTIFSRLNSKEPIIWEDHLEHKSLFNLLRKNEYESIIKTKFGSIPTVQPVFLYKACLSKFSELPIQEAQQLVLSKLKNRNRITTEEFKRIPKELRSIIYFSGLNKRTPEIARFLGQPYHA